MDEAANATAAGRRKFYGRRRGKTLRASQARLMDDLLPRLVVPGVGRLGDPGRRPIAPDALFPGAPAVWLEIGFGAGEHLARQAAAHPEIGMLGCEPFVNGVATLLLRIEAGDLRNIRLHPGDARDLLDLLPEASLQRVFLLYPDPWPKARHRDRRFVNPTNLAALARVMAPGAELRLASDVEAYVRHAVEAAGQAAEAFALLGGPADWTTSWADWRATRYEAKALREGRRPQYLTLRRR